MKITDDFGWTWSLQDRPIADLERSGVDEWAWGCDVRRLAICVLVAPEFSPQRGFALGQRAGFGECVETGERACAQFGRIDAV